ncbi:helix-turn-helix transcriptional regulator [Streptomyces sp. NPDC060027]|uniref:helix-turn-helix transcriptional regulator n=1 Tax=Streptomyces sp. NPDC060027 TaxID=3347040 RepID=UPI00367B2FFD
MHNRNGEKQKAPIGSLWIEDAAIYIGVKLSTLRKWRLLGKQPGPKGYTIGRFIAFKIADLDAYLEGQYQAAITPDPIRMEESRPAEVRRSRKPARAAA